MNELKCPNCSARIRSDEPFAEGTTMACPFCKTTFKLVAAGGGRTPRGEGSGLPPRAPSPDEAPAPKRRKAAPAAANEPGIERSRKTLAGFIVFGVVGLGALFISWYVGTVKTLTNKVDTASRQRVEQVAHPLDDSIEKKRKKNAASQAMVMRLFAPMTMEIGDLIVGVSTAEIAPVTTKGKPSAQDYLGLTLRVTNRSQAPVTYKGWQRTDAAVELRDVARNHYNRIGFTPDALPDGCVKEATIPPGETIKDLLVFEAPNAPYRSLEIDLPLNEQATFRFTVPDSMIRSAKQAVAANVPPMVPPQGLRQVGPQRQPAAQPAAAAAPATGAAAPAPAATPNAPASGNKLTPAEEYARRRAIIAEYRDEVASIDRRAKGMSYDRGRQFKRGKRADLLKQLSEKYNMTVDELRVILP